MFKLFRYFLLTILLVFAFFIGLLGQLAHNHIWSVSILAILYIVLLFIVKRADAIMRRLEATYHQEQARRQLSDTLREVSRIVSSSLDQQQVVDLILAQLEQVVTYHRATVSLLDGNTLTLVAGRDKMGGEVKPYAFSADKYPLNAETLLHKQPILVPDVTQDDRWQPTSFMQEIRSFLCAPLLVQEQPIGILAVGRLDQIPYTQEDVQTVFAFATQVAIAVRNAQLHAETQAHNRRLALLHDISLTINSISDLPTLLAVACQKLVENFHADHSSVCLFDEPMTYGEITAEFPVQQMVGVRMPLAGYRAAETVIATMQSLAIYDTRNDPLLENTRSVIDALHIRSMLLAPLLIKGRIIGFITLDLTTVQRHFEPSEIELAQTIATQLAMGIDNARLLEEERNRMEQEISTARQIQSSLLPIDVPDVPGLDIAGFSEPARQVGGDFYNYFVFNRNYLGIAVGDVSGKGLRAALMMTLSFGLLTTEVHRTIIPAELLTTLNTELRPHTQHNKMNTAIGYLTLTPSHTPRDGQWDLYAANAGLIAPLVRRQDGTVEWLDISGLPLGAVEHTKYAQLRAVLFPGDLVLLSSDGIVEARNMTGEIYGFDRLAACVANAPCQDAASLQECVLREVRAFVGEAETHDDLTMVVVMVKEYA